MVYIVSVPAAGSPAIHVDQALRFGPLPAENGAPGEGDFYAIAATSDAIFATSNGDDEHGWIVAIPIRKADQLNVAAGYGRLTRFLATKPLVHVDAPMGITMSPRGELVVGQMGEISEVADSRLTFYRLDDGQPLLDLATGLYDVTSIAYGQPQTPSNKPQLYALDFAWKVPDAAGLYRLDAQLKADQLSSDRCRRGSRRLDKPTAMALGLDGSLYVTVFGTEAGRGTTASGKTGSICARAVTERRRLTSSLSDLSPQPIRLLESPASDPSRLGKSGYNSKHQSQKPQPPLIELKRHER